MQWSDLWYATAHEKVAHRLRSEGDLLALSGQVALGPEPAGLGELAAREGVSVSTSPMPETVKDVGEDDIVRATVPREQLLVVGFPIVIPAPLAHEASSPDDVLRCALASGVAMALGER